MCTPLKHALVDHPVPAWRVAKEMGTYDVRLSKLARGQIEPTEDEKKKLSKILSKPVSQLFPAESSTPVEAA